MLAYLHWLTLLYLPNPNSDFNVEYWQGTLHVGCVVHCAIVCIILCLWFKLGAIDSAALRLKIGFLSTFYVFYLKRRELTPPFGPCLNRYVVPSFRCICITRLPWTSGTQEEHQLPALCIMHSNIMFIF